jgi:hypothetical protein
VLLIAGGYISSVLQLYVFLANENWSKKEVEVPRHLPLPRIFLDHRSPMPSDWHCL